MAISDSPTLVLGKLPKGIASGGNVVFLRDIFDKLVDIKQDILEIQVIKGDFDGLLFELDRTMSLNKRVSFFQLSSKERASLISRLSIDLTFFLDFQREFDSFLEYITVNGIQDKALNLGYNLRIRCGVLIGVINENSSFSDSFTQNNFEGKVIFNLNNLKVLIFEIYDSLGEFLKSNGMDPSLLKLLRNDCKFLFEVNSFLISNGFLARRPMEDFKRDFLNFLNSFRSYLKDSKRIKAFKTFEKDVSRLEVMYEFVRSGIKGLSYQQSLGIIASLRELFSIVSIYPLGWSLVMNNVDYFDQWYIDWERGINSGDVLARIIVLCLNLENIMLKISKVDLCIDIFHNSTCGCVLDIFLKEMVATLNSYNSIISEFNDSGFRKLSNRVFKRNYRINGQVDPSLFFLRLNEVYSYLAFLSRSYRVIYGLRDSLSSLNVNLNFLFSEYICSKSMLNNLFKTIDIMLKNLNSFISFFEFNRDRIGKFVKLRSKLISRWGKHFEMYLLDDERTIFELNNYVASFEKYITKDLYFLIHWVVISGKIVDNFKEQADFFRIKLNELLVQSDNRREEFKLLNVLR
ncbi:MAG TPA: hypothetical protein VJB89_00230 [Candidatus Nanoarchaeia archaeon]|nr:hypothetical protein [Candidatus Nanoarchaeia archaeon]